MRARLRRGEDAPPEVLTIGPPHNQITIDVPAHTVTRNGQEVKLTPLEFDLLIALARKPRQVFTREVLLEQVWGYRHSADTRLVNVHVQRLRAKIEPDPERPEIILTVRGVGYKAGTARTGEWRSLHADRIGRSPPVRGRCGGQRPGAAHCRRRRPGAPGLAAVAAATGGHHHPGRLGPAGRRVRLPGRRAEHPQPARPRQQARARAAPDRRRVRPGPAQQPLHAERPRAAEHHAPVRQLPGAEGDRLLALVATAGVRPTRWSPERPGPTRALGGAGRRGARRQPGMADPHRRPGRQ